MKKIKILFSIQIFLSIALYGSGSYRIERTDVEPYGDGQIFTLFHVYSNDNRLLNAYANQYEAEDFIREQEHDINQSEASQEQPVSRSLGFVRGREKIGRI